MISFKGKHFPKDIILLVVRWYVSYALSYRDIEEIMLERNIKVEYSPLLEETFRKNYKKKTGSSWRMDEIKQRVNGFICIVAVDKEGDSIDFMLSPKRDEAAAKAFFTKAIGSSGSPEKITIDKSGANKAGIDAINLQLIVFYLLGFSMMQMDVHQIKYLNNIVEQNHRGIKRITKPMMGFKAFYSAKARLVELNFIVY